MPAVAAPDPEPEGQRIDWPGIRAAAAVVGVRPAARQAAKHLPPDEQERFVFRVLKRSQREGWVEATKAATQAAQPQGKPMSSIVLNGADLVANTLAENHLKTKVGLSKWSAKSATHLSNLEGEEALAAHQPAVSVASVMTKIWPEQAAPSVRISMFAPGQVVDIEAEVIEPSCGTDVEQA